MKLRNLRPLGAIVIGAMLTVSLMGGCGDDDRDCTKTAMSNMAAAAMAPTPKPPPAPRTVAPRTNPPAPRTVAPPKTNPPAPRATALTRSTSRVTVAPPKAAPTTRVTPPANVPTKPVKLNPGNRQRKLPGESAYYPPPIGVQNLVNIYLAQDAVRRQVESQGRFTKSTRHFSPVTGRWYVYHDDDSYTAAVPQDLYDPFDPRNWTSSYSPFYLPKLVINNTLVADGPNVLNGDYLDDEGAQPLSPTPVSSTNNHRGC